MNARAATPTFMRNLRGQLRADEPMSRHTSWRVGGRAEYFYLPADREDVARFLRQVPANMPLYWIGLGSNLLVRDGGVDGVVVKTKQLARLQFHPPQALYAEAGVPCAKVARYAHQNGLGGTEFLAGVPGSFGGAITMNAGAFGGQTWDWLTRIECINRAGECRTIARADIRFGYRQVALPAAHWVLGGWLQLPMLPNGKQRIRQLLTRRNRSQPVQSANAGSVFRNPDGDHAARLLEQAGLKGHTIGDAVISPTHANFIINRGAASAADIERLIDAARAQVKKRTGIDLLPEIRIIGRRA